VISDERLNEVSKGSNQGTYCSDPDKATLSEEDRFYMPYGGNGESKADSCAKIITLLHEVQNDPTLSGKTIAVFTHGTPMKVLYQLSLADNAQALKHPEITSTEELKSYLHTHVPVGNPDKCQVVQYQLGMGNDPSLTFVAKLNIDASGEITTCPYPTNSK